MSPIDIPAIEQAARQMRAKEMQRINGLISARALVCGQLLAATVLSALSAVTENLRPLFSWNPQTRRSS